MNELLRMMDGYQSAFVKGLGVANTIRPDGTEHKHSDVRKMRRGLRAAAQD